MRTVALVELDILSLRIPPAAKPVDEARQQPVILTGHTMTTTTTRTQTNQVSATQPLEGRPHVPSGGSPLKGFNLEGQYVLASSRRILT